MKSKIYHAIDFVGALVVAYLCYQSPELKIWFWGTFTFCLVASYSLFAFFGALPKSAKDSSMTQG